MDRTKAYIGVYKNTNQESLFYQKDNDTYYDLRYKKDIAFSEIEKCSLISYNKIIKGDAFFKGSIIKLYELDRMKKISLDRTFIGNLCKVTNVEVDGVYGNKKDFWNNCLVVTSVKYCVLKQDLLLYSDGSSLLKYANFTDIETGIYYERPSFGHKVGDIFISTEGIDIQSAKAVLGITDSTIQKGKLLEKYREYKRR